MSKQDSNLTATALAFTKAKSSICTQLRASAPDRSKKGGVDVHISDLVTYLNEETDPFVTTSSCSGRVSVFVDSGANKKKGGQWIFISHEDRIDLETKVDEEIFDGLKNTGFYCDSEFDSVQDELLNMKSVATFKFEPFILHVQCRDIDAAQRFLACAISSGYRNSGIMISGGGGGQVQKIMVAVRSTVKIEAPIAAQGRILISPAYLRYLIENSNAKMMDNRDRVAFFLRSLKAMEAKVQAVREKKEAREEKMRLMKLKYGEDGRGGNS
eukprot:Nk52_evm11s152 gene=Nk52_evmTU11s152